MGVCGNVCCVAAVIKNSGFVEPWSVEVCCVDVMNVLFSVCVVVCPFQPSSSLIQVLLV